MATGEISGALLDGPYDVAPEEADLWFLPSPEAGDGATPGDAGASGDAALWQAAQAEHADALARVALQFGALDERLRGAPAGLRQRLALMEAAELSWHAGDRVAPDRLALWMGLRLPGARDDNLALMRAAWAARRLGGGPAPTPDTLAAFLARRETDAAEPLGDRLADWGTMMQAGAALHPFVRAAFGCAAWRICAISSGAAQDVEAMVVAARLAAGAGQGGALFLPLMLGGGAALRAAGPPQARLGVWLAAAERAALAALAHLDRLADWRERARAALAHRTGRTPPLLVEVLADWPLVSAPMAEAQTGASRASIQRNLAVMAAEGLTRELTGQGRYRVWTAAL